MHSGWECHPFGNALNWMMMMMMMMMMMTVIKGKPLLTTTNDTYCVCVCACEIFLQHTLAKMGHCQVIHNVKIYYEELLHYTLFEFK